MKKHHIPLFAVLSLSIIHPTHAKLSPKNNYLLDTVVVSATRTEVPYKKIPKTINILDDKQLDRINASSIQEALDWIPGVSINNKEPFYANPSVRGLSNGSTIITVDGLKISYNTNKGSRISPLNIDPFLVKQVEVEKGSSSVLYGSGGMGGLIAIQTKTVEDLLEPGTQFGGFTRVNYNDLNYLFQTSFGIYGTNDQKTFDWMLTGTTYKTKTIDEEGSYKSNSKKINAKLGFNIDENQRISLSLMNGEREAKGYGLSPDNVRDYSALISYNLKRGNHVNLKMALGHHTIKRNATANSPYAPYKNQQTTVSHSQFDIHNTQYFDGETISHELTYGINSNYFHQSGKADSKNNSFLAPKGSRREIGLFIQDNMTWKNLTLISALRYNDYKMSSSENPTVKENSLLPSIGANIDITSWLSLQANYSHDYRAPSVDELYTTDVRPPRFGMPAMIIFSNPNLKAEKSRNREIGFTLHGTDLIADDDSAFVRVSLFNQDIKNMIDNDGGYNPVTNRLEYSSVNRRSVNRKGVELEARYKSNNFTFGVGTDYLRTRDNEDGTVFHAAQRLNVMASYHFKNPNVTVSWLANAAKGRNINDPWSGTTRRPGYMIHNMNINWEHAFGIKPLSINIGVNNIFNKKHQIYNGFPGTERNVKLGLMFKL